MVESTGAYIHYIHVEVYLFRFMYHHKHKHRAVGTLVSDAED